MLCRSVVVIHSIRKGYPLFQLAYLSKVTRRAPMAVLNEHDLEESFVRGSGPGGQKINKSMNKVRLKHIPTGLSVACQEQRDLTTNRSMARKLLREKVDFLLNGVESKVGRRITKIQRSKSKAASRSKKKYSETDGLTINGIQEHDESNSDEFDEFDDDDDDYDDEFFSEDTEDDDKIPVESFTSPPPLS